MSPRKPPQKAPARRSVWAPAEQAGEEDRLIARFTERPAARARRIAAKRIDPITARALFRALGQAASRKAKP